MEEIKLCTLRPAINWPSVASSSVLESEEQGAAMGKGREGQLLGSFNLGGYTLLFWRLHIPPPAAACWAEDPVYLIDGQLGSTSNIPSGQRFNNFLLEAPCHSLNVKSFAKDYARALVPALNVNGASA